MIEYKGYTGVFEYQPETENFAGHVAGIRGGITFYGSSVDELKNEMVTSVDEYLAFCRERGIEPAKPYSGRFNVRVEPDVHRAVAEAAAARGESMNDFVVSALMSAASGFGVRGRVAEKKAKYEPIKKKPAPRRTGTGR